MSGCLFCRIVAGEIPSDKVYEDEEILAFRDIEPCAPVHILIIPKRHIPGVPELSVSTDTLIGKIFRLAARLAREEGVEESGFRVVVNSGPDAGQAVPHLHYHLLAGRKLDWPPG